MYTVLGFHNMTIGGQNRLAGCGEDEKMLGFFFLVLRAACKSRSFLQGLSGFGCTLRRNVFEP
jgi:hypothetical protein